MRGQAKPNKLVGENMLMRRGAHNKKLRARVLRKNCVNGPARGQQTARDSLSAGAIIPNEFFALGKRPGLLTCGMCKVEGIESLFTISLPFFKPHNP